MSIAKRYQKLSFISLLALASLVIVVFSLVSRQEPAQAADNRQFNAGNIMSDAVMSNKGTMSVQQIQAFLDSKNACNNTNVHMAAWYPHLQYSIRDGRFVCMARESFNGKSAAQIIWQVAQDYNINPQVLIVLLEKEQGLVSDTWPNHVQYRTATGFGCPDTAPCQSQYYGIENQLRLAANLFRTVLNGGWSNYPVGHTYVQYNPQSSCGGSVVHIQNRATSALYRYTPYQPNQSALDAGYGKGDPCGAYGNRNFWALFTDWFGNTQDSGFRSLDDPRWMKVSTRTQKINAYTGEKLGPVIEAGSQAKFIDKVFIGNRWVARTQWDHDNGNSTGFPSNQLNEINFEAIPIANMVLNKDAKKIDAIRGRSLETSPVASMFRAVDKVTVDNKTYYRTEWEKQNNQTGGFLVGDVSSFRMFDFTSPRFMVTKKDTPKVDILSGRTIMTVPSNNIYFFNKLIRSNGITYAQIQTDNGTSHVISASNLDELSTTNPYYSFIEPRVMNISEATTKYNIFTGEAVEQAIAPGIDAYFVDQVKVNGTWYARTKWDHDNRNMYGIRVDKIVDINISDIPDKWLTAKKDTRKIDPIRNHKFELIKQGAKALYKDKVSVFGKDYYRTEWEVDQNRFRFIPAEDLTE